MQFWNRSWMHKAGGLREPSVSNIPSVYQAANCVTHNDYSTTNKALVISR